MARRNPNRMRFFIGKRREKRRFEDTGGDYGGEMCRAVVPRWSGAGLGCTRPDGHEGMHESYNATIEGINARWPQDARESK